jgi:gluconokinase
MIDTENGRYLIGLDIGTGSAKAVAINEAGNIIADAQVFYSTLSAKPGYSEQDPEVIWSAFTNCINKIIETIKSPPISISLSSAMHSLMVIDQNGKAITNLITWADTRSEKIAERTRQLPIAENIYKETGTPIHSMSPLCKIIWLKENDSGIFQTAFKFGSIKEYIWYKLFGVWEVDHSVASATGLFNIDTFDWNAVSLKLCGINSQQLSSLVGTNFTRKNLNSSVASLLNIPATTPFCIGASDGCLANIGSYSTEPGTAALTIGTSGAVRIASATPIFNFSAMTFNYVLDEKMFICGGPVNNGGNVIAWLFKTFLNNSTPSEKDYEDFFKTIDTIPAGSNGLIFLPYLYGERAPVWDEKACGVFLGIKSFHSTGHFLRAALEGICYSLNSILEIVESSSEKVLQVNASGGFIHSATWLQILANITGKNICVVETEDASSIGAALLNMKSINLIPDYNALKPSDNRLIHPYQRDHETYEKYFPVFKDVYKSLKEIMHRVYEANV